jgi:ATP/maltotriose-dependent transcriptional regulator MalT
MDALEHGRECYRRHAWGDAYQALVCADQATPLEPDDLDRLATSAYLTGRDLDFQRILERVHRIHVEVGARARAARSAFWLGLTLLFRGEIGQANAWTARGERLIQDEECVERGYLLVPVAAQQVHEGQARAGYATANEAAAIGERFGDPELTATARHLQGHALIQQGDIAAGLRRLDETMLAVVANELSPIMTGLLYCSVIELCQQVYALGRAREWTSAFSSVCEQQPEMVAFSGICLVHRAEILQFQGAWPDALREACRACERAERAERKPPGGALYQQAEIHRLCGEFEKAEDAYRAASDLGHEPQPGLALLRLVQGRTDAAAAAIKRLTGATNDRLRRARLLPAHVDIMLATGDLVDARGARDELRALAQAFDTDVLRAVVAQADGGIALAEGHPHAALDPLRHAFELWMRLEAPYEAARVRVLIGRACRALGDEEAAALEHQAARAVFERLEARPDLARLDSPIPFAEQPSRHRLTRRELDVLRLVANGRTNKEIADTLCLSERTIDRHVSNILGKLDVPSRAAATAYAYHHKLF